MSDRKASPAVEGEARHPAGDVPGVQGCFYVTAGTEVLADGSRVATPNKGAFIPLDAVSPDGTVYTYNLFIEVANGGGSPKLRVAPQVPVPSTAGPLAPGAVLPALPGPNTNADGTVIGP